MSCSVIKIGSQVSCCNENQHLYLRHADSLYSLQPSKIDGYWAAPQQPKNYACDLILDVDLLKLCPDPGNFSGFIENDKQQTRKNEITNTLGLFIVPFGDCALIHNMQSFSMFKQVSDLMV